MKGVLLGENEHDGWMGGGEAVKTLAWVVVGLGFCGGADA